MCNGKIGLNLHILLLWFFRLLLAASLVLVLKICLAGLLIEKGRKNAQIPSDKNCSLLLIIHFYHIQLFEMASFAETFKSLNLDQPDMANGEGAYAPKNIMITGGAGFM